MRTAPVHPNAENATPEELRVAMEAAPNKRSYIRLAALRSLLLGIARATVCQQFCRTDRMIRLGSSSSTAAASMHSLPNPSPDDRAK